MPNRLGKAVGWAVTGSAVVTGWAVTGSIIIERGPDEVSEQQPSAVHQPRIGGHMLAEHPGDQQMSAARVASHGEADQVAKPGANRAVPVDQPDTEPVRDPRPAPFLRAAPFLGVLSHR